MAADTSQGGGAGERERALEELVFEALELLERDGPAALDAFYTAHSKVAPALRERLRALRDAGLLEAAPAAQAAVERLPRPGGWFARALAKLGFARRGRNRGVPL